VGQADEKTVGRPLEVAMERLVMSEKKNGVQLDLSGGDWQAAGARTGVGEIVETTRDWWGGRECHPFGRRLGVTEAGEILIWGAGGAGRKPGGEVEKDSGEDWEGNVLPNEKNG